MAKQKTQSSPLIVAMALPALVIGAYAANYHLRPSEDRQEIARLEAELEQVKAGAVPDERRLSVVKQIAEKKEELEAVQADFDGLRRRGGELMRAQFEPMSELVTGNQINQVLTQVGLRFVDERPSEATRSLRPGLLGSLTEATEQLGETLTELASQDAADIPIILPADFPRDENPILWMEQQRRLRIGNFDGPETREKSMRVVGDYQSMVAGLQAIVDTCPNVVVAGIGFERSAARRGGGPQPHVWDLQLQLRPRSPSSRSGTGILSAGGGDSLPPWAQSLQDDSGTSGYVSFQSNQSIDAHAHARPETTDYRNFPGNQDPSGYQEPSGYQAAKPPVQEMD
ncbi:MAG: hypothetical protein AAF958_07990 [Planctomycetota bacterium]